MSTLPQTIIDFLKGLEPCDLENQFPFAFKVFIKQNEIATPVSDFNQHGYDKYGYDEEGYNIAGYNKDGYDTQGFDKTRYDASGFNIDGYDTSGFNREGYNASGYNKDGYNASGHNKNGLYKSSAVKRSTNIPLNESKLYREGYVKGYKSGYKNYKTHQLSNVGTTVTPMSIQRLTHGADSIQYLLVDFSKTLENDASILPFKNIISAIKVVTRQISCQSSGFKDLYFLACNKDLPNCKQIDHLMFSVPREFRKEPIRTKFLELFKSCCDKLDFAVVNEENFLYENPIVFLAFVPYYFNFQDVYKIGKEAFSKFGEIIFDITYENNFQTGYQSCYFILNANKNCVPEKNNLTFTFIDDIPSITIDDFSSYKNAVYKFTYKPLSFKHENEIQVKIEKT